MTPANSLVLGLGLFFLGLRLIGENLRRLYGSSFRSVIKRTTHSPLLGAGLGTLAGAVMQSATAVTFILVSLTDSGLIKARAAAPIIVWSNVGLTALAFVTTLDIHPMVAYLVGGAGIALGTLRIPFWQTLAGSLLGMGLILFGLEKLLSLATRAAETERLELIRELLARTKLKGEEMTRLKEETASASLSATALFEDFSIAVWTLRRLAKLLARMPG
jgi:phosphate:Na+ symporter